MPEGKRVRWVRRSETNEKTYCDGDFASKEVFVNVVGISFDSEIEYVRQIFNGYATTCRSARTQGDVSGRRDSFDAVVSDLPGAISVLRDRALAADDGIPFSAL